MALQTFHLFGELPKELQALIWKEAAGLERYLDQGYLDQVTHGCNIWHESEAKTSCCYRLFAP